MCAEEGWGRRRGRSRVFGYVRDTIFVTGKKEHKNNNQNKYGVWIGIKQREEQHHYLQYEK
jgi:hypothetical protein